MVRGAAGCWTGWQVHRWHLRWTFRPLFRSPLSRPFCCSTAARAAAATGRTAGGTGRQHSLSRLLAPAEPVIGPAAAASAPDELVTHRGRRRAVELLERQQQAGPAGEPSVRVGAGIACTSSSCLPAEGCRACSSKRQFIHGDAHARTQHSSVGCQSRRRE